MKLLDKLSYLVVNETKYRLDETNKKLLQQLIDKYTEQTDDSEETIVNYINAFSRYKSGLPSDQRDIVQYTYDELKTLIDSKTAKKSIKDIYNHFKRETEGVSNLELKQNIKRFVEMTPFLSSDKKNIRNYSYYELVDFLSNQYNETMLRNLPQFFQKKKRDLTDDIVKYYVERYLTIYDDIDVNKKPVIMMSFDELEHLIDEYNAKHGVSKEESQTEFDEELNLIYDKNNLKIYLSETKNHCIQLAKGRSWCISRKDGSNMFYNYRLDRNLTTYFVINEDLDFKDLNYALVILVDSYGNIRMADRSNSGNFSGSNEISWNTAYEKCPKLRGLEDIFQPKPLTDKEKKMLKKFKNVRVEKDAIEELGSEENAELWLEINSPDLTGDNGDIIYSNLTDNLKKKFIGLGGILNYSKLRASSDEIISYYVTSKLKRISEENKSLKSIDSGDIDIITFILNNIKNPNLVEMAMRVKELLLKSLSPEDIKKSATSELDLSVKSTLGYRIISLFGFDYFVKTFAPYGENVSKLTYTADIGMNSLDVPEEFTRFSNLRHLNLSNVKSLPENFGDLIHMETLSLTNNTLTEIPESIVKLNNIVILTLDSHNDFEEKYEWFNSSFKTLGKSGDGNSKVFTAIRD